jgi:pilus assembly protein Flp/PilA
MHKFAASIRKFTKDESGATMVEYALMIALVAAACVVAVTALGTALAAQYTTVAGNV